LATHSGPAGLAATGLDDGGNVRIETRVIKRNPERLRSDSA
jgi:hypothetical protein